MGASATHPVNTTIEAGLPNMTGTIFGVMTYNGGGGYNPNQALTSTQEDATHSRDESGLGHYVRVTLDASRSNPIYGASNTVQPPAYCLYIWKRIE